MNLKVEKGITLIALIITIIVMLIILGIGMYFGTDAIETAKLEDVKTDMISIKTKAKIIVEQYNFKDIDALVGDEISNEEANKLGISNKDNARKMSSSALESQGLSKINGDEYIVYYNLDDPNNCEIYYIEGYDGRYSLSELQDI